MALMNAFSFFRREIQYLNEVRDSNGYTEMASFSRYHLVTMELNLYELHYQLPYISPHGDRHIQHANPLSVA